MALVNTTTTSSSALAGLVHGVAGFFRAIRETIETYRLFRRTEAELAALNDRELADLGIHRGEIERVALRAAYGLDN
jgi:uncharacterized protein YjiS (DUF1127 family)